MMTPLAAMVQCEAPCPCCFYRISSLDENGEYTPGWRKFGGVFKWFHKTAPHARPWAAPGVLAASGCNASGAPRCRCCYYNYSHGLPPGPGWYVGEWSVAYESYTWQWNGHGAPHRPLDEDAHWATAPEDALFMQAASGSSSSSSSLTETKAESPVLSQDHLDMLARMADDSRREEEFLEQIRNEAHGESPMDDAQVLSPLDDAIADQPVGLGVTTVPHLSPNADHVDLSDME